MQFPCDVTRSTRTNKLRKIGRLRQWLHMEYKTFPFTELRELVLFRSYWYYYSSLEGHRVYYHPIQLTQWYVSLHLCAPSWTPGKIKWFHTSFCDCIQIFNVLPTVINHYYDNKFRVISHCYLIKLISITDALPPFRQRLLNSVQSQQSLIARYSIKFIFTFNSPRQPKHLRKKNGEFWKIESYTVKYTWMQSMDHQKFASYYHFNRCFCWHSSWFVIRAIFCYRFY